MPSRADIVSQTPEEFARDVIRNTAPLQLGDELTITVRKQDGSNPDLLSYTIRTTGDIKPVVGTRANFEVKIVKPIV